MESARKLVFTNPATGEQFGELPMARTEEVERAVREMRQAARVWARKPVRERVALLRQLQGVMVDALDEITDILNQDCGKSRQDALLEVFVTLDLLDQYCRRAPGWLRRQYVSRGFFFFKNFYIEHRPYGVVAVIAPWNYPFGLAMPPVISALLAGNTVVLKPSEITPGAGLIMEKLLQRVPGLADFVRVVHGDGQVGEALVRAAPDYIFLTGSVPTGQKVIRAAADHLVPVACELGGKDALLVLDDADLEAAAHWGVWGSFYNTGQFCVSVEQVYVAASVYDRFIELAVKEAKKLKVGYSRDLDSPYYMGPMTDPRQVEIIRRHLEDAVSKGARVLLGGGIQGMYVEPTVLVDVDRSMLLMQEETFGPIMPVLKVKDEWEAASLINASEFGLGASIWSSDLERAQRVAHSLEVSSIAINDVLVQFTAPMLPFGGVKKSGYGRIHGKEGLMQFTRPYSYAVGHPPYNWDLTTVIRRPGNYRLISALTHLAFGVTPRQKLQPLVGPARLPVENGPRKVVISLGLLSVLGAAAGLAFALIKIKHKGFL